MTGHSGSPGFRTRFEHELDSRSVRLASWLYRRTRGRIARLWQRKVLLLTTTGRRTGRPRTVPLQYFPDNGSFVVVAANSGLPTHPAWYLNLDAHPQAHVEIDGRTMEVSARQLVPNDADEFWPRILDRAPDYARYPQRASRDLPLIRLTPLEKDAS